MTKSVLFVIGLSLAAGAALRAAETAPQQPPAEGAAAQPQARSEKPWFKNLLMGLQKSAVEGRYHSGRAYTVAAVRGAEQGETDAKKPYWKGSLSEKQAAQFKKEREEFAAAVEVILAGNLAEGGAKLDAFEAAHPKSKLIKEVRDARQKLDEMKKQSAAESKPKPEQKAEQK